MSKDPFVYPIKAEEYKENEKMTKNIFEQSVEKMSDHDIVEIITNDPETGELMKGYKVTFKKSKKEKKKAKKKEKRKWADTILEPEEVVYAKHLGPKEYTQVQAAWIGFDVHIGYNLDNKVWEICTPLKDRSNTSKEPIFVQDKNLYKALIKYQTAEHKRLLDKE